jgi:alcohol dehydrogenase (cytochrome c)
MRPEGWYRAALDHRRRVIFDARRIACVIGPAASFSVGGKQYIAVQSGWGIDARAMQNRLIKLMPGLPDLPEGGAVWVFSLRQ